MLRKTKVNPQEGPEGGKNGMNGKKEETAEPHSGIEVIKGFPNTREGPPNA